MRRLAAISAALALLLVSGCLFWSTEPDYPSYLGIYQSEDVYGDYNWTVEVEFDPSLRCVYDERWYENLTGDFIGGVFFGRDVCRYTVPEDSGYSWLFLGHQNDPSFLFALQWTTDGDTLYVWNNPDRSGRQWVFTRLPDWR